MAKLDLKTSLDRFEAETSEIEASAAMWLESGYITQEWYDQVQDTVKAAREMIRTGRQERPDVGRYSTDPA
jgi:hypothetical protein